MKTSLFLLFIGLNLTSSGQSFDTISVYFDVNSSILNSEQVNRLSELRDNLKSKNLIIHQFFVYCDSTGSIAYNAKLGTQRYYRVLKFLDLNKDQFKSKSKIYGEEYPVHELTKAPINELRRVEIIYSKEQLVTQPFEETSHEDFKDERDPSLTVADRHESPIIQNLVLFLQDSTSREIKIPLSILFVSNSDIYLPESEAELIDLFDFLHFNQNLTAHIMGHVCCGDDYELSSNRAYKVYKFLTDRSISPDRLSYKGYSNKRPLISPEITDEDRKINRRVDVIFTKGN